MSAFYDLASLVLVPSGYKASKVYAQKPLTTDGQLTFSRASTATRVNSAGLIETVSSNVPRLDYQGSTCPKLLLEPQRTNLALYSEQLNNAEYTADNAAFTANATASPDGYTNADLLTENSSNAGHGFYASVVARGTTGASLTTSIFAKSNGRRYINISGGFDSGNYYNVVFDLQTGAVSTTGNAGAGTTPTASIVSYGNGWYRCIVTGSITGLPNRLSFIYLTDATTGNGISGRSYTGNGTSGVYFYGLQIEEGAYATSYVKTEAAAVTRLADACFKASTSSILSNSTGTLFLEVERQGPSGADPENLIFTSDTSLSNFVNIVFSPANNRYRAQVRQGGTTTGFAEATAAYTGTIKIAAAWSANNLVLYINGVLQATDTSVTVPSATFNSVGIGSYYDGAYGPDAFRGSYKQALIFKTALTNAQLAELTAL